MKKPGNFVLYVPVWFISHPAMQIGDDPLSAVGFVKPPRDDEPLEVPMFTDEDLARTYIETTPKCQDCELIEKKTFAERDDALRVFQSRGAINVAIDPGARSRRIAAIADILE